MILSKKQVEYEKKVKENLATIRVGDAVVCVDCWEAELYGDKEFKVISEPWQIGGSWCVKLEGIGAFDIGRLKKV